MNHDQNARVLPPRGGLVNAEGAAELVGVSLRTIQRWHAAGTLKPWAVAGRTPYFHTAEVYRAERASRESREKKSSEAIDNQSEGVSL